MKLLFKHLTQTVTIYFLSGSQIFSTAEPKTRVPVTIEADPKVVNLYFLIVGQNRNSEVENQVANKETISTHGILLHNVTCPCTVQQMV